MTRQERFLQLFLRMLGSVSLLAVFAVVMPYSWMNATHQWLGMGKLPDEPVVGLASRRHDGQPTNRCSQNTLRHCALQ